MPETLAYAEVWLWDHFVGAVAEADDGTVTFEYDPEFRGEILEISPLTLPLSTSGPVTFPELRNLEAFEGLPGVLADALPDRFGNAVIKKYFSDRGRPDDALRPVQKLLYIGDRAMGALEFRPPTRIGQAEQEPLDIAELVRQARVVISGEPDVAIPDMMRLGASAGGARAKALILWNPATNEIRSDFATPHEGDEHWILKFDGVGELGQPDATPKPFNRVEHAYAQLARDAGIEMPEIRLLEQDCNAHLMVRRFDRSGHQRVHMHSLGGLHHADYNSPGEFSYEQFLRTILTLNLGYPTLDQAFRRAVFNIVAVNQDDHVKNISFLMNDDGDWRLAPAYDLTFARGEGYTRLHQMSLNGKRERFKLQDLVDFGAKMGINRDGREVIEEVVEALSNWSTYASAAGVPEDMITAIGKEHRFCK